MTDQEAVATTGKDLEVTERSRVRRRRERGRYDRATVHAILDSALICHVGVVVDGAPIVLPTTFARIGDTVYLHGARANHLLRAVAAGTDACIEATIVDGIVFARSAFNHSMNYRSVVLHGAGAAVESEDEKRRALDAVVERMAPGRSGHCRPPTPEEMRATLVVRFPIEEASAKVRSGGAIDEPGDLELDVWAGVLPLAVTAAPLAPDVLLRPGFTGVAPASPWGRVAGAG
jgi:nitroimidazol reductase NimA-like FMN-containing flavoprotein (pyridoxamine 5'-phosphate oxidase superfamily)